MTNSYKITNPYRDISNQFCLYIEGEFKKQIYDSLTKTKIIKNTVYDVKNESLYFNAEKVINLSTYLKEKPNNKLSENECINLIFYLSKQIKYNELTNYTFYGFDLDDILVIDDEIFIIANSNNLLPIKNNFLILDYLFTKPYFNSPELQEINILPAKIHYKSCYYSLGCLVTYLLLKTYLLVGNDIKDENELDNILLPFYYTKLYWFLKRCLIKDYNKRILLLV